MFHVLVLAGGSGTRLWPLSRAAVPKHLLPIGPGGTTLLRATVERVLPLTRSVHVVTAASQAAACREALAGLALPEDAVIAEPQARGTGPALGLATRWIASRDPDAVIASVHADHHVDDVDAYRAAVLAAGGWAGVTGGLVCVGLVPAYPATGFGYVETAGGAPEGGGAWRAPEGTAAAAPLVAAAAAAPARAAVGFVEKPSPDVAERYVHDGRHLWNTGLFAWPARRFEEELAAADPGLAEGLAAVVASRSDGDDTVAAERYASLRSTPVEPLLFERTGRLTVVEASFGWSDLGSWADLGSARRDLGEGDADGNVGRGDALVLGSRDCLVDAGGGRPVVVVGAEGLVVVDTGDAVLVVPAAESQRVKDVVDRLRADGRTDLL